MCDCINLVELEARNGGAAESLTRRKSAAILCYNMSRNNVLITN